MTLIESWCNNPHNPFFLTCTGSRRSSRLNKDANKELLPGLGVVPKNSKRKADNVGGAGNVAKKQKAGGRQGGGTSGATVIESAWPDDNKDDGKHDGNPKNINIIPILTIIILLPCFADVTPGGGDSHAHAGNTLNTSNRTYTRPTAIITIPL